MTLPALIRAKIARAQKGYLAVSVDLEELERWAKDADALAHAIQPALSVTVRNSSEDR